MTVSYLERLAHDPALRAFVEAQAGQIAVELAALKIEFQHAQSVIAAQKQTIATLEQQVSGKRKKP